MVNSSGKTAEMFKRLCELTTTTRVKNNSLTTIPICLINTFLYQLLKSFLSFTNYIKNKNRNLWQSNT